MHYFAWVSMIFGVFAAWLTFDDWKYKKDPMGYGPWGHYSITVCMAVGSVSTIVTALWAMTK
jgi:hypothetical protein